MASTIYPLGGAGGEPGDLSHRAADQLLRGALRGGHGLLTRGAGFGYIGSTITSLIYASFTFLFFALEAAIMALALELYFRIPLALAYVICSIIVIPW